MPFRLPRTLLRDRVKLLGSVSEREPRDALLWLERSEELRLPNDFRKELRFQEREGEGLGGSGD